VEMRIERLSHGLDGFEPVLLEHLAHLLQYHLNPVGKAARGVLAVVQREFEVVHHRQQTPDEALRRQGTRTFGIPRDSLAIVVEVRGDPLEVVEIRRRLVAGSCQLNEEEVDRLVLVGRQLQT